MDAATTRQRYPAQAWVVDQNEARFEALRRGPQRPSTAAKITRGSATVGKVAVNFLVLLVALPILAVLLFFTFEMLKLAAKGG